MELSAENFRGERKSVKLESLVRHPDLQGRADPAAVKKLAGEVAEAVKAGAEIDPIKVIHVTADETTPYGKKIPAGLYVVDGFRRTMGYEMAGRANIPAVVRVGTWRDATDVATSANADQVALPRTPEDKRRQVELSLRNHPSRSFRWHSQHCKVGNELPQQVWKAIEKSIPQEVKDQIEKEGRVGKNDKKQTAKKKPKPKAAVTADKAADWKRYEESFNFITRFIDHVGELDGKKQPTNEAHKMHRAFGEHMLAWKDRLAKEAVAAAERAKAEAEKAADKEQPPKAAKSAGPAATREDADGKGKGK